MKRLLILVLAVTLAGGCQNMREPARATESKETPDIVKKQKDIVIHNNETNSQLFSSDFEDKLSSLITPLKYTLYTVLAIAGLKLIGIVYPYAVGTAGQVLRFADYLRVKCEPLPEPNSPQAQQREMVQSQESAGMLRKAYKWCMCQYYSNLAPTLNSVIEGVVYVLSNLYSRNAETHETPNPQYPPQQPNPFNQVQHNAHYQSNQNYHGNPFGLQNQHNHQQNYD
ncbi:MAG: hypothetical protein LE169_05505 [Endomicrobium sp.]|nr:hypothetical protein [Endomicrobium sp.]